MTLPTYTTGTVSVSNGDSVIVGAGTIWSGTNVKAGDTIYVNNAYPGVEITDVTDITHIAIPAPWSGGAQASVPYTIVQNFPARVVGVAAAQDVSTLVAALNKTGFYWFVDATETVPDPSRGDEGQYARQPTTGKEWVKTGGLWVYQGISKPLGVPAPYDSGHTYSLNDVATSGGSSYIWINATPGSGFAPPNATYWQVLAAKGDTGAAGPTGASYAATSTTSLTIGTGSKAFTTQSGLAYTNGARVRATSAANTANWMEGLATYSGTALTINVDKTNGSGTLADWNFNLAGQPGAVGVASLNGQTGALAFLLPPQGRATLTSGVPITTSDVVGATSVYWTPSGGNQTPIYDGSNMIPTAFSELTLALDSNAAHSGYQYANENFDGFVINDAGTVRFGTGPGWANGAVAGSAVARGTGAGSTEMQLVNGIWTNKNSILIRYGSVSTNTVSVPANRATYVGSIRTTADGVTEDSAVKRFLYNAYNPARRQMSRQEPTASWAYSTASYRQMNGSASNQIAYLAGLTGSELNASVSTIVLNSTSTPRIVYAGIGLDSTTVNSRTISNFCRLGDATLSSPGGPTAQYVGYAQLGYHYVAALEKGAGTDTQTWFGVSGSDYQTGITGYIFA